MVPLKIGLRFFLRLDVLHTDVFCIE